MRVSTITPRLFVVTTEAEVHPDSEKGRAGIAETVAAREQDPWKVDVNYVPLLGGYTWRARFSHWILRLLTRLRFFPPALAALPLRLCEAEILETLRGCRPGAVRAFELPWAPQLDRLLRRNYPEWLAPALAATRVDAREGQVPGGDRVSIVLPTYNGARYLAKAIESCLAQSFENIELIVVDDASGPEVRQVVERFGSDRRLHYERHERNAGVAAALNTGFRRSTGTHLTWTSDDNYYEAHAIEEMLGFLKASGADFVYAESWEVNAEDEITRLLRPGPPASLRINNAIGACFLYTRRVYDKVGDYRPILLAEDYDYWIRVAKSFRLQRLFQPLYYYRAHPASLTGRYSPAEVEARVRSVKRLNKFGSRRTRLG